MRRARDDRGSALVEFCWVGLVLFIPLTWIVISVFEVQRGAFAVNGAARAAARAFALAPDDATGRARAEAVATQTLADQGSDGMVADVRVSCGGLANCHTGTAVITVEIRSRVEMPLLPEVLAAERRSFALEASHTVPIGQYVETGRDAMRRDDRGSAIPLIVGLAGVLVLAIAVVVNASSAFMQRQSLDTLADGAALYGADIGSAGVYAEGLPAERLLQEERAVRVAVQDYLRRVGAYETYGDIAVVARVDPAARAVTVVLSAPLDLPLTVPGTPSRPTVSATGRAAVTIEPAG